MPIPPNLAKQEFHFAYFRAVVADAGAMAAKPEPDIGIDYTVFGAHIQTNGKPAPSGLSFLCQLKSTTDWKIRGDHLVYAVDADAYNKLASLIKGIGILVVYVLPQDDTSPLSVTEEVFELRKCCYWYRVPRELTDNTSSKTIYIPRSQVFDRHAVAHLLEEDRLDAYSGQVDEK